MTDRRDNSPCPDGWQVEPRPDPFDDGRAWPLTIPDNIRSDVSGPFATGVNGTTTILSGQHHLVPQDADASCRTEEPTVAISTLTAPTRTKGPTCSVCRALATIDPKEADAFRGLLANPDWPYTALSEALRNDPDTPLTLSAHALGNHARGQCAAGDRLREPIR